MTCYSKLSRNRAFGERVGRGDKVSAILASTRSVAEGYPTALAAWQLARKLDIQTPIIDEVHAMLYQNKSVRKAVQDLMGRDVNRRTNFSVPNRNPNHNRFRLGIRPRPASAAEIAFIKSPYSS